MTESVMLAGTRKGLFVGRSDAAREAWAWDPPAFAMEEVYAASVDPGGSGVLLVGSTHPAFGPAVYRSTDLGRTYDMKAPAKVQFPDDADATVERVWQLQPSPCDPDVVWAGTQPSALFRSEDGGRSFALVRSLWDHPHRPQWAAGFGGQAIHTIVPHPTDPDIVTVAMSTGGVYRTGDRGQTWQPHNSGIRTDFLPNQEPPEFGQCVHKVAADAQNPDVLYAQNHGGVFRSHDAGRSWESIAEGLPADFGFPIVAHPHRSGTVYVFPLSADILRFPPDGRPAVWRSDDSGRTWCETGPGLPAEAWTAVLRDAFSADHGEPAGLYIGTRHGAIWASNDEGGTWAEIRSNLPDVCCVRAAVID